ncbi:MAG: fumarylacetoacetate hydrolase family protein [Candidatus Omnitrophica bacterium]|nr:fumarylacetoacetate hydrolase family protein [Candidatus Omnitrophota bacterium]
MKIARAVVNGTALWGMVQKDVLHVLRGNPFDSIQATRKEIPLETVCFLPPSVPTKIILAGLNYKEHALELSMELPEEPVIFMKPVSSLSADKGVIMYPRGVGRLDYEAEMAVIIKKPCRNIREKEARDYIFGYTCLNDVTARDLQKKDGQWTRAKSFDTFCPVGPWVETENEPAEKRIRLYLNKELKQDSSTADFIFNVEYLISFVSRIMTLFPGDIISTGTPPGVGPMRPGDTVTVEIDGIGQLINTVQKAPDCGTFSAGSGENAQ